MIDQPIYTDQHGTRRFKANAIVEYLLNNGPFDMNHLARLDFPDADRVQFAQLIGYSVSGWGDLSYVSDEDWDRVNAHARRADVRNAAQGGWAMEREGMKIEGFELSGNAAETVRRSGKTRSETMDVHGNDNTPEWGYCKTPGCNEPAEPLWFSGGFPDDPDLLLCYKHTGAYIGDMLTERRALCDILSAPMETTETPKINTDDVAWLGRYVATHQIGEHYTLLEYKSYIDLNRKRAGVQDRSEYAIYVNGRAMHRSATTFDSALLWAMAYRYEGANTHAAEYMARMIGVQMD